LGRLLRIFQKISKLIFMNQLKFKYLFMLLILLFVQNVAKAQPNSSPMYLIGWTPAPVVGGALDLCASANLLADTTGNTPLAGDTTFFYWDFGNGNVDTLYLTDAGLTNGFLWGTNVINFAGNTFTPGCYNVQLTVSNDSGTDVSNFVFCYNVVNATLDPIPASACFGSLINLSVTMTSGVQDSVQWDFGDGTMVTTIGITTSHDFEIAYGDHVVSATVWENGCQLVLEDTITITQTLGLADFTYTSGCPCGIIQFTNTSTGAISSDWNFGDGNSSSATSPSHTFGVAGDIIVSLHTEDVSGCKATKMIPIPVCPMDVLDDTSRSKSNNHWYTQSDWEVDFNSGTPVINNPIGNVYAYGSTYADPFTGQAIFYLGRDTVTGSSGYAIFNALHQPMSVMNANIFGLLNQTIIPNPQNPDQYYVFFRNNLGGLKDLMYTIIDMTLNGGLGGPVAGSENIVFQSDIMDFTSFEEKVGCPDDPTYWLAVYDENHEMHAYKFTTSGINPAIVSYTYGGPGTLNNIQIEYSPNGQFLATRRSKNVNVYQFDALTGNFVLYQNVSMNGNGMPGVFHHSNSMCFSPDNSKLYICLYDSAPTSWELRQYDLSQSNILSSETILFATGVGSNPLPRSIAPGPDGKLYVGCDYYAGTTAYQDGIIDDPNQPGLASNYISGGVGFNIKSPLADDAEIIQSILPRFVPMDTLIANFEVDTIPCFTYNVVFTNLSDSIDLDPCSLHANDTIYFWDFGDGNQSAIKHPTHSYTNPGTYTVSLVTYHPYYCSKDTFELDVTIDTIPTISAVVTDATCFGDSDGAIDQTITGGGTPLFYSWAYNGSIFEDQNGLAANTYDVTMTFDGCDTTVSYVVNQPVPTNPGNDTIVNICQDMAPFDLTEFMGGTPDAGGSFTSALASGTLIFDPLVDADGTYTYAIGGTCPASATIGVTVINCEVCTPNLVPNPSFENVNFCPNNFIQMNATTDWSMVGGSADYLNTCGFSGNLLPATGNGYTGLLTVSPFLLSQREYIQAQLTSPLVSGKCYELSFKVAVDMGLSDLHHDSLGMFLTTTPPALTASNVIAVPQLATNLTTMPVDDNWVTINGVYTAVGGEEFITLGLFTADNSTITMVGGSFVSYMGLDDICVRLMPDDTTYVDNALDNTICSGQSSTFSAPAGSNYYHWVDQNTLASYTTQGITVSPTVTTDYVVFYGDTTQCQVFYSMDTVTVTVNPLPAAPTAGTDATYCDGDPMIDLTVSGSGGTFNWYSDAGLTTNIGNGTTLTPGATIGTTTYYVAETLLGCEGLASSVDITINALPAAPTAGTDATYCVGDPMVDLTVSGMGATFNWYSDAGLTTNIGTGATLTPGTTVGTTTYYVAESVLGCEGLASSVDITINVLPVITNEASTDITDCLAPDGTITITANGTNYELFTSGGASITNNATGAFTAINPGDYYVEVTLNGCTVQSSNFTIVNASAPAAPTAGTDATYCDGDPLTDLTATAGVGGTLNWYDDGGLTNNIGTGTTLTPNNTIGATIYYVTETFNNCESAASQITITITAIPLAPVAGTDATFCDGDPLTDLSAAAAVGGTLNWYDDAALTNNIGTGATLTPNGTVGATIYYVTESVGLCEGPASSVTITIIAAPAAPTAGTDATYCQGDPLTDLSAAAGSGGTLNWFDDAALTNNIGTGTTLTPGSTVGTTTYYVTETVGGCSSVASLVTIVIDPSQQPTISPTTTFCLADDSLNLDAFPASGSWTGSGITNATDGTFDPLTAGVGNHWVYYTLAGACGGVDSVQITVRPQPQITAFITNESCEGLIDGEIDIEVTGGTSPYVYNWSTGETVEDLEELAGGSYDLIVTDASGCSASDTLIVLTEGDGDCDFHVWVANVFSPNSNGENDVLFVRGKGVSTMYFRVFNRWGQLVFESTDLDFGWDGMYKGKSLNAGVFVYVLEGTFVNGSDFNEKGSVTLIR